MAFLDKLKYHVWNPLGAVTDLIRTWKPTDCVTEKDYERSLYKLLHEELGGVQVTKQFANGRLRADLVVGERVLIELKLNLDSTGKYHRLIGQLEDYRIWNGDIIVVLLGATDMNLRKKLEQYASKRSGFSPLDSEMRVIEKQ